MSRQVFDALILIARPAAGKSEIIHYLKTTPADERKKQLHVGQIDEIDDFPMLWAWFEEDDLLTRMGHPRLYTDAQGYFKENYLWDLLIERIGLEYRKRLRDYPATGSPVTTLIEFARGSQHGGFQRAFEHLSAQILERAAILYIDVSFEESLRKNRRRYNPDRPDSILEHGMTDEKMALIYKENDWQTLSGGQTQGHLTIQGYAVPFVVFPNADDVTTLGGELLGSRLEKCLEQLWKLYRR